ncbi:transketolase [Candidatus Bealeia paramacronuclearis]
MNLSAKSTSHPLPLLELTQMANAIRVLSMDIVEKAQSGHPGMPMGMADVATVLFRNFLKFSPNDSKWLDRDRFVLSAGHGSALLYSLLYLTGYPDMHIEDLKAFRTWGSKTAGHPEYNHAEGIETTTGPLGQGLANAVGMALAQKLEASELGAEISDHKIYTIVGDGCLMEGISHEAISLAGHLKLNNLIVLFDDNGISIDGPTSLSVSDNQQARFKASGWAVDEIDGHNFEDIFVALTRAQNSDKPVMIACKTQIAKGSPNKAGTSAVHGSPLGAAEIQAVRTNLSWRLPPFEIPQDILKSWRDIAEKNALVYEAWQKRWAALPKAQKEEITRRRNGDLPSGFEKAFQSLTQKFITEKTSVASRQSSQMVLDEISTVIPELLGGSADLTGSNNTQGKSMKAVTPQDFSGRYIHYGVREHAMGAMMNGIALHGGFIPYGGTFLVFVDYLKPALRLSALMGIRVIYVMTHDSIGLGEDGPTHQPIEQLASLRAVPNLHVFRPCDAVEVAESWSTAIALKSTPSVLTLTRQKLPLLRTEETENLTAKGGYILRSCEGAPQVILIATGSEVEIAVSVHETLRTKGVPSHVVSMPCTTLFDEQDATYKKSVLGAGLRVAIEAASPLGWDKYVGEEGLIFGMTTFGASAPYQDLYRHFGFTQENITAKILEKLGE